VDVLLSMTALKSKTRIVYFAIGLTWVARVATAHAQIATPDSVLPANPPANQPAAEQAAASPQDDTLTPEPPSQPGPRRIEFQPAIEQALQRAVSIELSRAEILRAEGLVKQARAGWLPKLTGNGSYTRLDHERTNSGLRVAARDQWGADLRLTVPLVAARSWVDTSRAKDNLEITRADALEERRQIATSVASTYLAVMAQHRVIEVNERALRNAKAHYDYAHTRFAGGIGNELDDVRAAQEYESSVSLLERSRAELVATQ
jgi:outer membrane protein TolC